MLVRSWVGGIVEEIQVEKFAVVKLEEVAVLFVAEIGMVVYLDKVVAILSVLLVLEVQEERKAIVVVVLAYFS